MKIKIEEISDNPVINLVTDTIKKKKQAIVFTNTKRSAEKTAEDISKTIKTKDKKLIELSGKVLEVLSKPTKQCERLARCIKKGIAFHHAGLTEKQKELIEENFRKGIIKIICATPTLAYGVDLPAFRVIIRDLRRYSQRGLAYIPVLEYLQFSGRAGRPKFDNEGQSIIITASKAEKKKLKEKYIYGKPEDIYSKLSVEPVLRTYVLSLISSDFVNTREEIFSFFSKTFYANQFSDEYELKAKIEKMLHLLEKWEFVKSSKKEFISADKIEEETYKATQLGKRVSELYIDPLTAHNFIEALKKASKKKIVAFSLLQTISSTLEIRPLLRVKIKEYDKIEEAIARYGSYFLGREPSIYDPEYEDFLRSIKTTLFFQDWINEKDEEYLLENYDIRPGEIRAKIEIADWLLYAMEEICRIIKLQSIIKDIIKLRIRVKNGIREELIPLIKLKNIGRARARKLYFNEIKTIGDVIKVDLSKLTQILGKKTAIEIKKQVGQNFETEKTKEKKQTGLYEF